MHPRAIRDKIGLSLNRYGHVSELRRPKWFTNLSLSQGSLDNIVTRQPRAPPFSTDGLVDYLVELVVCEDKAFQLIDKGPLRRLLTYLRPSLSDKDIPHRQTLRSAIINKAKLNEVRVKELLKVKPFTYCKR